MVDVMDHSYRNHGHQRSFSSLASSIIPMASDTSTVTSVTASPLDLSDSASLPIELKIPLPPSRSPSNHDTDAEEGGNEIKSSEISLGALEEAHETPEHSSMENTANDLSKDRLMPKEPEISPVSWKSLLQMAQEEHLQRWQTDRLEKELGRLEFANSIDRRLKETLSIAYGNLIDQFKGDDQAGFTGIYEASDRLASYCSERQWQNPENAAYEGSQDQEFSGPSLPLLPLQAQDQDILLAFINRIRTDLDYLADLISNLPSLELASLTSCYHPAGVDLSVLPNHSHGRTQAYSRDSQMMKLSRRMDNIELFHHQDPYFTLLYNLFDTSAKHGSSEHALKVQVWANTCAKVMTTGKSGSEEFAVATIDSFVDTADWNLKPQIEVFLLQVLADGWFILDPPEEDTNEKAGSPIEPERATHAIAVADFFDKHTRRLFSLLSEAEDSVPRVVREFIHATLRQIGDPQMRELAKKFIVSRWYFAIFLSSVLVYPEVQGLCLNHHIGSSARHQILNKLVVNLQSQVFSVLAPSSSFNFIPPEVQDQVFHIMSRFDPSAVPNEVLSTNEHSDAPKTLLLSQWDIAGLIDTLHPNTEDIYQGSAGTTLADSVSQTSSTTLKPDRIHSGQSKDLVDYSSESADDGLTDPRDAVASHDEGVSTSSVSSQTAMKAKMDLPTSLYDLASQLRSLHTRRSASSSNAAIHERLFLMLQCSGHSLTTHESGSHDQGHDQSLCRTSTADHFHDNEDYYVVRKAVVQLINSYRTGHMTANIPDPWHHDLALSLERQFLASKSQYKFLEAHEWWTRLSAYNRLLTKHSKEYIFAAISHDLFTTYQHAVQDFNERRALLEAQITRLEVQSKQFQGLFRVLANVRNGLRVKMWYASDVKNSAPYEDALRVTRALRAMASQKKTKTSGGLASWAKQRLRGMSAYDRADKQALETMVSTREQGGLSKLDDEQLDLISKWIVKNNIENICPGEERIHRFTYEVQKLINKLSGTSLLESPVLWSSYFFRREKVVFDAHRRGSSLSNSSSPITPSPINRQASRSISSPSQDFNARLNLPMDFSGLQITTYPPQQPNFFNIPSSNALPLGQGIGPLSPPMTPRTPKASDISNPGTIRNQETTHAKAVFVDKVKKSLLALVNSDLGYILWAVGSETDSWVNRAIENTKYDALKDAEPKARDSLQPDLDLTLSKEVQQNPETTMQPFGFSDAYKAILESISLSPDPNEKLRLLGQLEELVVSSLQAEPSFDETRSWPLPQDPTVPIKDHQPTTLEQAITHCRHRHTSTLKRLQQQSSFPPLTTRASPDSLITALLSIFRDPALRPPTLFRDLQLIAYLLPSSTLDHTPLGLTFWTASLAALLLKEDLLTHTVSRASAITENHLRLRSATLHPPLILPHERKEGFDAPLTSRYSGGEAKGEGKARGASEIGKGGVEGATLKDAANLWLVAAKERHPVAARELALFYLTHPDLIRKSTAPMSRGRDVFGAASSASVFGSSLPSYPSSASFPHQAGELEGMGGGGGGGGGGPLDRNTFCVVRHWMEVAAQGGDREAGDFLRENGGRV